MGGYLLAATVPDSRCYLGIWFNHRLPLKHEVLEGTPSESPEHEVVESVPSESPDHEVLEGAPSESLEHEVLEGAPSESPEHEVVEGAPSLPILSPSFAMHFTNGTNQARAK